MRAMLLAVLLLAPVSHAALAQTPFTSEVRQSKELILADRIDEARTILENLNSLSPDRPDVLFLLADIAVTEKNYEKAIDLYRHILVKEPNATRVRLELARTFFMIKDDENAEHHFRITLGDSDLPPGVTENVERFLAEIRARKRWSINLMVSLAPDTNLNNAPSSETVVIGGLPYRLSDDSRKTSGMGIASTLGGTYIAPVSDQLQIQASANLWRAEYGDSDFDDMIVTGAAGPNLLFPGGKVAVLATGYRRWYANELYSYAVGGRINLSYELTRRLLLETTVEGLHVHYDTQPFRNGPLVVADASLTYGLSSSSFVRLLGGVTREQTEAEPLRNTGFKFGVGVYTDLPYGFTAYVEPQGIRTTYDETDPLFGQTREDTNLRVRTSLSNRQINVLGFMPVFSYIYSKNWSSIDFYDYDRHQFMIGVTRQF